jgi:hypothetical protein
MLNLVKICVEEYDLMGYNAVQSVESQPTFRRNILPPALTLLSCSAYFSTLKMEAICSSVTLVDFQWATQRYIPQDSTLHNHHCENLKSYKICVVSNILNVLHQDKFLQAKQLLSHLLQTLTKQMFT